jgi:penicillin-binding protein 2
VSVRIDQLPISAKSVYRFGSFGLAIVVAVAVLSVRMFDLQVVQPQGILAIPSGQSAETIPVPSSRGVIMDATGKALVVNLPNFVVQIVPELLPVDQKAVVVRRLASLLNIDPVTIDQALDSATGSLFDPVEIASKVNTNLAQAIDENADLLPGVQVVSQPLREYTNGGYPQSLFSTVLGYTGAINGEPSASEKDLGYSSGDVIGLAGLESSYEAQLRGTPGKETVALDSSGQIIPGLTTSVQSPTPGESLTLSISSRTQYLAYNALLWGIERTKVKMGGVIIVENPQNGQILAMVSLPGYDNNMFAEGISQAQYEAMLQDPAGPLINKAISEQYPPGSTYKLVTGTAGLAGDPITGQKPSITATSTIPSLPYIQIGDQRFGEWNGTGWGPLTIIMGLAHSSDTFFYQLALKVGLTSLTDWAKLYGFGKPTGIDLPGEVGGIVPDDQWKQAAYGIGDTMFPGEIAQAGIGQGFDAVTPMQLLNAYCALANGGNLWQPTVVKSTTDPDGTVHDVTPTLIRKLPVSSADLETLRQGTRAVVTSQHTYNLVDLPVMVAGKTGTAEFGTRNAKGQLPYHEWFVGYTPGDAIHGNFNSSDSQVAVVAFLYGADSWGDMSTEIVKYFLWEYYGIKGSPLAQSLPGHVQLWASKITNNYYGSASNH